MVELTPNPSFSIQLRIKSPNRAGMLARVMEAIAAAQGSLSTIDLIEQTLQVSVRDVVVDAYSEEHAAAIVAAVGALSEIELIEAHDRTFQFHQGGKITVNGKYPLKTASNLAMAYTPGVGRICQAIAANPERSYELTIKGNTIAIVSDGSAVLGLGNLGAAASLPVMEGKALLFKEFAGVDAFPICLNTQDTDEIVETVKRIAPVFGGINLEDIAAPRCFEIEARLRAETDILIFHDDQHGTAIVVLAALTNALKLVKKALPGVKIVINGAGAAGMAIAKLLQAAGAKHIIVCDSKGILSHSRIDLNSEKQVFAVQAEGGLADAIQHADIFIGVSAAGVLTSSMVASMARQAIVFAMANPVPEIQPEAISDLVAVIATGRSDYPNQINNVLAFPGIFRGALDCRATKFTERMYLEAATAIANLVSTSELTRDKVVPSVFDNRVALAVAAAVRKVAIDSGIARIEV